MTHSLYRQGTNDNLGDDFVIFATPDRRLKDLQERMEHFREIGFQHGAVNVPGVPSKVSRRHLVYDGKEKVCEVLRDLAQADLGLSVIVSGLRDRVNECCKLAGLTPHTANQSFGIWGKTERLEPIPILEISTMCGHGRVAPDLIRDKADKVSRDLLDVKVAARQMGQLCVCNIFNEVRAARLLKVLAANLRAGLFDRSALPKFSESVPRKDFGISIEETRCIQCLECIPHCPAGAIVQTGEAGKVAIDADRCTECGLCRQAGICPADAIAGLDLKWPRSLRGTFQRPNRPYSLGALGKTTRQLAYCEDYSTFRGRDMPSEHTNDVRELLKQGDSVLMVELGRPHLGTTFEDVQKVTKALVPFGLNLGEQSPASDERGSLAEVAADISKGTLLPEILQERAGWVVLRVVMPEDKVPQAIQTLKGVAAEIDTVFSLGIVSRVDKDRRTIAERVFMGEGVAPAVNCKTNVGLGVQRRKDKSGG
jgi:ferredoxin